MASNQNIVLIGMPGSGKSSMGVVLAKALNLDFVDTDLLIQIQEQKTLSEIIESKGLDAFLKIEEDVCASVDVKNHVIATGGSVVYSKKAMEHLKRIGVVLHLNIAYNELEKRLGSLDDRGVAHRENQTLKDLYDERIPLYKKWCDKEIDVSNLTIEETVRKLVRVVYK